MKVTRFLLSVLFLGAMVSTASAQFAYLSWDACNSVATDKAIAPGSGVANLYVSVLGQSQPHKAYQAVVLFGSGNAGALRDAWRFDAVGCQTDAFISISHSPPAAVAKACPGMTGANSLQIKNYSFDAISGKATGTLASAYDPNATAVNPAVRYHLANFAFDHTYSVVGPTNPGVDCGDLEVPVCAHLARCSWLMLDGTEMPYPFAKEYVTANDPANGTGCPGATPAAATTWGSIKHQYKR